MCSICVLSIISHFSATLTSLQVYADHLDWVCPNKDDDNTKCPYIHGIGTTCSSIKKQHALQMKDVAKEEVHGKKVVPGAQLTEQEQKRQARKERKKASRSSDQFTCTMAGIDDCKGAHNYQIARLASHALLEDHQHAGKITSGKETETLDQKRQREQAKKNKEPEQAKKATKTFVTSSDPVPEGATSTIVIRSISYNSKEDSLRAAFEQYGELRGVKLIMNDEGKPRVGFIDFINLPDAVTAYNAIENGAQIDGRKIRVSYKEPREGSGGGGGNGGGGGSRACFKCHQEGHISKNCPVAGGNAGNSGYGNDDVTEVSSAGAGWDAGGNDAAETTNEIQSWSDEANEAAAAAPTSSRW